MLSSPSLHMAPSAWGRVVVRSLASWWHMLHFAATVLLQALSPSTYSRANRAAVLRQIDASARPLLPWFTALAALLSLVLVRIVVVTALSYGLSHLALHMVVQVLILELIPLSAALYAALRLGLAFGPAEVSLAVMDLEHVRSVLVPRALAMVFAVLALTVISSAIALVLAYLSVYGFTTWGLPGFARVIGRIFTLPVTLIFALKAVSFSLAVALVPMATRLTSVRVGWVDGNTVQAGSVRLLLVLLWIEAISLVIRYF